MKLILLCILFFASYVTTSHAMEGKENQEKDRQSLPTKLVEKQVKDFLIDNINEILIKGSPQYSYADKTWKFRCSLNFFNEWKRQNEDRTISDMISSHDLILYPSIAPQEDNGTSYAHKNNNFLVFIGNDGRNVLILDMDRVN
ncbi:MAG TPA: hypothetical protein VMW10_09330 [Alphaproteobacteria bacterium]|nr:hypothetical protein [Alphaproteobacteria bacterium]